MKFTFLITFLLLILPTVVFAQEMELEKFVSKNCAAFVVIEEPSAFLDSIENFSLFENPRLTRAWEILQNEEYPILSTEVVKQLESHWEKFKASLAALDKVSFVLHPIDGPGGVIYTDEFYWEPSSIPKFSIILAGGQKVTDEIERTLLAGRSSALEFAASSISDREFQQHSEDERDRDGQNPETYEEPELDQDEVPDLNEVSGEREPKLDLAVDFFKEVLDSVVVKKVNGGLIVSNDEKRAGQLSARLANSSEKTFRPLSDHRAFKAVQKLLEERSDSPGVRVFFVPENLPELGAQMVTSSLPFKPKSLRAGGVFVSLDTENAPIEMEEANFVPLMEWEFVLTIARPAEKYGKIISSFKELQDLPEIALPITRFDAFGFDSQLRNEAFEETIGSHQQKLDVETPDNNGSASDEFANYNDYYDAELYGSVGQLREFDPGSVAGFSDGRMEFRVADVDAGVSRRVEMHAVEDLEKMEAFFLSRVKEENRYFEDDRRFVEVDNEYGRLFARELAAVRSMAKEHRKAFRGQEEPIEIPNDGPLPSEIMANEPEFFFNDQWMICTDHVTMRKVLRMIYEQSPASSKFNQIFQLAKKRNGDRAPVKIGYQSVERRGRRYNSIERQYIMDKFEQLGQEKEMWEILNSEPDEFGLYNAIESEDDALVAISQLVSDAIAETFDSSIRLHTVEDFTFRVFGQIYSKVEK